MKLVEREREGLEGDKQQAEAYLQKEQECLRAQSTIFLKFIWTAQVGEEHAGTSRQWHIGLPTVVAGNDAVTAAWGACKQC